MTLYEWYVLYNARKKQYIDMGFKPHIAAERAHYDVTERVSNAAT